MGSPQTDSAPGWDTMGETVMNPSYCLSTALSDLVLHSTCLYSIWTLYIQNGFNQSLLPGVLWFILCGLGSCLGTFRFGMKYVSSTLQSAHTTASLVAGSIGMSLLASHYHQHQYSYPSITTLHLTISVLALPVLLAGGDHLKEVCVKAVAGVSTVSLLVGGLYTGHTYPAVGAGLVVAAAPMDRYAVNMSLNWKPISP